MFFKKKEATPTYRHELKYICSEGELLLIQQRIQNICSRDAHASPSGIYHIRSLYFDDLFDTCYLENQNGISPREKFRIRIYNGDLNLIKLECKRKERTKTQKTSCRLSEEQLNAILENRFVPPDNSPQLLNKFYGQCTQRMLEPKIIVAYERTPFIYEAGNVRITFDRNLSYSSQIADFTKKDLTLCPAMPLGKQILEVKYDEFLPDYLFELMNIGSLRQDTCSKYCLCRDGMM